MGRVIVISDEIAPRDPNAPVPDPCGGFGFQWIPGARGVRVCDRCGAFNARDVAPLFAAGYHVATATAYRTLYVIAPDGERLWPWSRFDTPHFPAELLEKIKRDAPRRARLTETDRATDRR